MVKSARSLPAEQSRDVRFGHRTLRMAVLAISMCLATIRFAGEAEACAFHLYKPAKTPIDWIIESDHVVVARTDPKDAFRFKATETLVDGGREQEITYLADSTTRRRLTKNPDDTILFAFDAEENRWRRIAYLTPDYRRIVDRVLAEKEGWNQPYDEARLDIFEALQDHPEQALRDLAIMEIDKVPYASLQKLDLRFEADDLLNEMNKPAAYPYFSIHVLLLGLSDDDAARARIHELVDVVAHRDRRSDFLGAFATALVEIDGLAGIHRLENLFLSDPLQPLDKLEQVVEALAIHSGTGADHLRTSAIQALERMIEIRPTTSVLVARQFGSRMDWALAAPLERLVADQKLAQASDLFTVAIYVAQARAAGATRGAQGG